MAPTVLAQDLARLTVENSSLREENTALASTAEAAARKNDKLAKKLAKQRRKHDKLARKLAKQQRKYRKSVHRLGKCVEDVKQYFAAVKQGLVERDEALKLTGKGLRRLERRAEKMAGLLRGVKELLGGE